MPTFPSGTTPFREMVRSYFEQRPNQWIDATQLEGVGGRQAWRTRVSDCRRLHHMFIENRQHVMTSAHGNVYKISQYRYCPDRDSLWP